MNELHQMKVSSKLENADGDPAKILQIAKDAHHPTTSIIVYKHKLTKEFVI